VELKNDKEVVLEAIKQYGYAFRFASVELKNDKEVVLEAIKQNGYALEYNNVIVNSLFFYFFMYC
jgi:hypothetical protein